jgi:hypothetical protein
LRDNLGVKKVEAPSKCPEKQSKLLAQIFKGIPGYVETDGEKEGGSHVGGEHCHVAARRAAPQVLVWGTHRLYRKYIFMVTLKGRGLEMVFVSKSGILDVHY